MAEEVKNDEVKPAAVADKTDAVLAKLKDLLKAAGSDVTHFDDVAALAKKLA